MNIHLFFDFAKFKMVDYQAGEMRGVAESPRKDTAAGRADCYAIFEKFI